MTDKTVCATCSGVGLVGGFVTPESGYQDEPCPDCRPSAPPKPAPDAMRALLEAILPYIRAGDVSKGEPSFYYADNVFAALSAPVPPADGGR